MESVEAVGLGNTEDPGMEPSWTHVAIVKYSSIVVDMDGRNGCHFLIVLQRGTHQ